MFTKNMFVHVLQINNTLVSMFTRKYFTLVGPGNLVNYTYQSFHLNSQTINKSFDAAWTNKCKPRIK